MKNYAYQPARVVEGKTRWYIMWYGPGEDGASWKRYRETFDLNRIPSIPIRRSRAQEIRDKVNWWLGEGKPAWAFNEIEMGLAMRRGNGPELGHTPARKAIQAILEIKCAGARKNTVRSLTSTYGLFIAYMVERKIDSYPIENIGQVQAAEFFDRRISQDSISNATYNNNLNYLRGCWHALKARGYVNENIFARISVKKAKAKKRRAFTQYEARTIIGHVRQADQLLFYGLLLQYLCYIRPVEIRRLRRRHFNFDEWVVEIPGRETKSYEERYPSIPVAFRKYFDLNWWSAIPANYIIFGLGWEPHPSKPCGDNRMYRKHRAILEDLVSNGHLDSMAGLTWYSWKDTGISEALEQLPLIVVQDQAGHSTPDMTLKYRTKRGRNERFGNEFENKIL
ncbi:MAG: site-specific integrase [Bacteroidota bacterium]